MKFAQVIVSLNTPEVDKIFHYIVPPSLCDCALPGSRCFVPFGKGNKTTEGFIIGFSETSDVDMTKMKELLSVIDEKPLFSPVMLSVALWMKEKYYTTLSGCLNCIMPPGIKGRAEEKTLVVYVRYAELIESPENRKKIEEIHSDKQRAVIDLLNKKGKLTISEIKNELKVTLSPITTLEKQNILKITEEEVRRNMLPKRKFSVPHSLTEEQQSAFSFVLSKMNEKDKKPILIHGVTGSGKTEIYMRLIDEVIKRGKQAIVLVPEISLTPQTVQFFIDRFGDVVSVTHSRMSQGERLDQWKKAKDGGISIMVGPRSAIFTPFKDPGIIIIDEEHEQSYKSETSPKYYVKHVAYKLSELTGCTVLLGSATPSVETYYEAKTGKAHLVTLKERVNKRLPDIFIKDMRLELANGNRSIFSDELAESIEENIKNKEQTILFLNRRGYSTFVSCRNCGYVMACEKCSINYTYHKYSQKLVCHYCGQEEKPPENCPVCGSRHIKFFGVGTQKIEEEVNKMFPAAVTLRMDFDTTSKKNGHARIIQQFSDKKADILIGTQMIAKGLNFPGVSLVGIVASDLSLNYGDFRSAETTFQLLTQVSGRAGRAEISGKVYIQTYNPEHYAIEFAKTGDYESFYEHEIAIRRQMQYPPFSHLFSIMFYGEKEKELIILLYKLLDIMKRYNKNNQFELLGPAPASVSKVNNNYRWKIIVKCLDEEKIRNYVMFCMDKLKNIYGITRGVSINLSLNPSVLL